MSLTNRFSVLLLATLGFTLIGFSVALFVSSRVYLDRQADERLGAILTLPGTCVDPGPGWVRWEPRENACPRAAGMNATRQHGWSSTASGAC
jgi:hypothetical protein